MHEVNNVLHYELYILYCSKACKVIFMLTSLSAKYVSQVILKNQRHKLHPKSIYVTIR